MENMLKFKRFLLHPLNITISYPFALLLLFWWTKETSLLVIFICYVLGFASITIHEIGHMIAGFCVGSKLHFMSAGAILILPGKKKGLRIALNPDTDMMLGMESNYIPLENLTDETIQKKMISTYLGGPIISLIMIGLGFLVRFMEIENAWLWDTISYFIIINIALFFATAIPFADYTDGSNILKLVRKQNIDLYRIHNQYLNPNYKLTSQKAILLEKQINETPQLAECYMLGIMLIHDYTSKLSFKRSLLVIEQLTNKLTKKDGLIMENLIYFYRGLLLLASKSDIDNDTLIRLKNINYTYGRSFCYLAKAMIYYTEGIPISSQQQLLNDSKKWLYLLMDHRQEDIINSAIQTIQKEMCA